MNERSEIGQQREQTKTSSSSIQPDKGLEPYIYGEFRQFHFSSKETHKPSKSSKAYGSQGLPPSSFDSISSR